MILTAAGIREARRLGEIVLEPFDKASLNPNTYNLHLDSRLLRAGSEDWEEVIIGEDGFVLEPQELFLASTVERFGGHGYVPLLSGRSSVGRLGLFVHLSSDMGSLGAVHAWTSELFSALPFRLYAGMPIVQVSFWRCVGEQLPYEGAGDRPEARRRGGRQEPGAAADARGGDPRRQAARGKPWRTTKSDPAAQRRPDLVERDFSAEAPNRLWVGDFTYLRSWEGALFFSFVIDAFSRKVVGWQLASHMRTDLVLDALRIALGQREHGADFGLVAHTDRGSQYTSADYTQELDDHRVLASVGTVGDAYDNAMAESFVDTFKTELIADRIWRSRSQLELAVVEYIAWFNNDRLHESLGDLSPAEFESLCVPQEIQLSNIS